MNGGDLDAKVKKLCSTGRAAPRSIRVHDTAMPFSLHGPPRMGDAVPTEPLQPPGGPVGVWLE